MSDSSTVDKVCRRLDAWMSALLGGRAYSMIRGRVLTGMAASTGLLAGQTLLYFGASIALARLLGADGYGSYRYALTWVGVLVVLGTLGFEHLGIRKVAALRTADAWRELRGFVRTAGAISGIWSFILAVVAVAVGGSVLGGQIGAAVGVGLFLLPLEVFLRLRQGTLQGLNRPLLAQVPETVLRPLLVLVGAGILLLTLEEGGLRAVPALFLYIGATLLALVAASLWLQSAIPEGESLIPTKEDVRDWLGETTPMMLIGAMYVVNNYADILLIGVLAGAKAVGVYAVASRGAQLVIFVLRASNKVLAPEFANLAANETEGGLQRVLTSSTRVIFAASLPVAAILLVFGSFFLGLFGEEFKVGTTALSVLVVAQVISVAAGPVGYLLMMTGYERIAAVNVAVAAVINIVLNLMLIPPLGIEGAAIATATSTILVNILQADAVRRWTSLRPTVLALTSHT